MGNVCLRRDAPSQWLRLMTWWVVAGVSFGCGLADLSYNATPPEFRRNGLRELLGEEETDTKLTWPVRTLAISQPAAFRSHDRRGAWLTGGPRFSPKGEVSIIRRCTARLARSGLAGSVVLQGQSEVDACEYRAPASCIVKSFREAASREGADLLLVATIYPEDLDCARDDPQCLRGTPARPFKFGRMGTVHVVEGALVEPNIGRILAYARAQSDVEDSFQWDGWTTSRMRLQVVGRFFCEELPEVLAELKGRSKELSLELDPETPSAPETPILERGGSPPEREVTIEVEPE